MTVYDIANILYLDKVCSKDCQGDHRRNAVFNMLGKPCCLAYVIGLPNVSGTSDPVNGVPRWCIFGTLIHQSQAPSPHSPLRQFYYPDGRGGTGIS